MQIHTPSSQSIQTIVEDTSELLSSNHKSIAFAESATAGYLMASFACVKYSAVLKGGIVCHDPIIKTSLLNIDPKLVDLYSAESIPVTEAITEGLSAIMAADIHIGLTGLLKPGGSESKEKPVGTFYICLMGNQEKITRKLSCHGSASEIRQQVLHHTCMLLVEYLSGSTL